MVYSLLEWRFPVHANTTKLRVAVYLPKMCEALCLDPCTANRTQKYTSGHNRELSNSKSKNPESHYVIFFLLFSSASF